ncbi:hypothetical protein DYD21_04115 [Rhodohalobacter sp. SW132]|uniref:hypothetical protein n=1 Tax=Rhodohalobacter sp. SW132 TaxID=2293433 RepID=UPI000E261960|nr:hypothetical protein [Rhodohalobacter sp. SW132]REL39150.1 hypothetical protein DYD21_04115 [Rhodohalobacter sp. SW132]
MKNYRSKNEEGVYNAIGHFVVEFSHLHSMMELMSVNMISNPGSSSSRNKAWILVSDQTTYPVMSKLFSLLMEEKIDVWSSEDKNVINSIRKEIIKLIEERNRISHDIWSLGHPNTPISDEADALRFRNTSSPKKGISKNRTPITITTIKELIQDCIRLREIIVKLGLYSLDDSNIKSPSQEFELNDDQLVQVSNN